MKRFVFLVRPHLTLNDGTIQWTTATVIASNIAEARKKIEADGIDAGAMWASEELDQDNEES